MRLGGFRCAPGAKSVRQHYRDTAAIAHGLSGVPVSVGLLQMKRLVDPREDSEGKGTN